jgi:hypothetical protein
MLCLWHVSVNERNHWRNENDSSKKMCGNIKLAASKAILKENGYQCRLQPVETEISMKISKLMAALRKWRLNINGGWRIQSRICSVK